MITWEDHVMAAKAKENIMMLLISLSGVVVADAFPSLVLVSADALPSLVLMSLAETCLYVCLNSGSMSVFDVSDV